MFNKKSIVLILACLLLSISAVSAVDNNSTDLDISDSFELSAVEDNVVLDDESGAEDDQVSPVSTSIKYEGIKKIESSWEEYDTYYTFSNNFNFTVVLKDADENPIENQMLNILTPNENYSVETDANGEVIIPLSNLEFDESYNIIAIYGGSQKYNNVTYTAILNIWSGVYVSDSMRAYGSDSEYLARFEDLNGKPLSNEKVTYLLNGKEYYNVTDEEGWAFIKFGLKEGIYNVTAINPVNNASRTAELWIVPRLVKNKNIVTYYQSKATYKIGINADDGLLWGAPNQPVKFTIVGKGYKKVVTKKTGTDGYAKLSVNFLKPGKYTVTAQYKKYKVSNKITIQPLITKDITKKYNKPVSFNVKLVNSKGKVLTKKVVKVNFKGKTYKLKTNSKGIATLKITKKINVGKYTIKTTYNKLTVKNTLTVKK